MVDNAHVTNLSGEEAVIGKTDTPIELGSANTDSVTGIRRIIHRSVTYVTDMNTDIAGTQGEVVWSTTDNSFYGCITTGVTGAAVWELLSQNTKRVTTTYQILTSENVIFANTDAGDYTVTLPVGVANQSLKIINCGTSSNTLTVDGSGTEKVYGELTQALSDGDVIDLNYDAVEGWY